jgi:hypothetical protein
MRSGNLLRRALRVLAPAVCVGGLMAATCSPAQAAPDDFKGFLFALDLALTQPSGLDSHIATVTNTTIFPSQTQRIVLDNDADVTWSARVGYGFGLDMGKIQVSYWSFDNDDKETFTRAGFLSPALFGYGFYGAMYICNTTGGGYGYCDSSLPLTFTGGSGVKAHTLDLDYSRDAEVSSRFHLNWLAGLRVASYQEERSFEAFDGTYLYLQDKSWDADAWGIRVGAGGTLNLTEHFGLRGSLAYSALLGSTEGEASQTFVNGGLTCGFPPCKDIRTGKDDNLHGNIVDLELKGVWSAGPVDVSLGFASSTWSGFVGDPVPAQAFRLVPESPSNESIGFDRFEVGVLWRIGSVGGVGPP